MIRRRRGGGRGKKGGGNGGYHCLRMLQVCESVSWLARYDAEGLKYLYNIDQHMDEGAHARGVRPFVIDATRTGNVARFINHR